MHTRRRTLQLLQLSKTSVPFFNRSRSSFSFSRSGENENDYENEDLGSFSCGGAKPRISNRRLRAWKAPLPFTPRPHWEPSRSAADCVRYATSHHQQVHSSRRAEEGDAAATCYGGGN